MLRTALIALWLGASGCPSTGVPPVSAKCVKHGDKCKTPAGPLGVCDTIACPAGETGLCFKCMPQH